ncbi:serine/threonine protein kinase, partial [Proteus mirabilis]
MDKQQSRVFSLFFKGSLVKQILVGLVAGILLAWLAPEAAKMMSLLGTLFISALKAVAPILVWVLVMASIANHRQGQKSNIRPVLILYLLATFFAALTAVVASFMFPSVLTLVVNESQLSPPENIAEVLKGVLINVVANPVDALINGNYMGILAWSIGLGLALRHASDTTKALTQDLADAVTNVVRVVIRLAPIGIFGLVSSTIATTGF